MSDVRQTTHPAWSRRSVPTARRGWGWHARLDAATQTVHIYIYTHTHTHIYIYMYVCIYSHTHTHIYIHIYKYTACSVRRRSPGPTHGTKMSLCAVQNDRTCKAVCACTGATVGSSERYPVARCSMAQCVLHVHVAWACCWLHAAGCMITVPCCDAAGGMRGGWQHLASCTVAECRRCMLQCIPSRLRCMAHCGWAACERRTIGQFAAVAPNLRQLD